MTRSKPLRSIIVLNPSTRRCGDGWLELLGELEEEEEEEEEEDTQLEIHYVVLT